MNAALTLKAAFSFQVDMVAFTRRLLLILLLALAWRLAIWAQPMHEISNDEVEYVTVAHDLLEGRGWSFYEHYRWLRAPLYPLFLAASFALAPDNPALAMLPNMLLSLANVALIALLTLQVSSTPNSRHARRAALLAALFAAVLQTFATFGSLFMSETLFTFCFLCALCATLAAAQAQGKQRIAWLVGAGIAWGLAALTRSVVMTFLPLVALWLFVTCKPSSVQPSSAPTLQRLHVFWLLAAFGLTIGPWTLHNCLVYERCIPIETGLSYNLWAFNEPRESLGEIHRVLEAIPNPAERSDEATRRGMERLREDPLILARKLYPNWVLLWRVNPIVQDRFRLTDYTSADAPPLLFLSALIVDDALLLLLAVLGTVGLSATIFQRHAPTTSRWIALLLAAWLMYSAVSIMFTHGEGRYRHFLLPILIIYAARAVSRAIGQKKTSLDPRVHGFTRSRVHVLTATLILTPLIFAFLSVYPWQWAGAGALRSMFTLQGDLARASGNLAGARDAYWRAIHTEQRADTWLRLGDTERAIGNQHEALQAYRAAVASSNQRYADAFARLGDVLRHNGETEQARRAFTSRPDSDMQARAWATLLPASSTISLGTGLDYGFIAGFYPAETIRGYPARWSGAHSELRLHTLPNQPALLDMMLSAPRSDGQAVPIDVCVEQKCDTIAVDAEWQHYELPVPANTAAIIYITLQSPTFDAPDGRKLGVLVASAELRAR